MDLGGRRKTLEAPWHCCLFCMLLFLHSWVKLASTWCRAQPAPEGLYNWTTGQFPKEAIDWRLALHPLIQTIVFVLRLMLPLTQAFQSTVHFIPLKSFIEFKFSKKTNCWRAKKSSSVDSDWENPAFGWVSCLSPEVIYVSYSGNKLLELK